LLGSEKELDEVAETDLIIYYTDSLLLICLRSLASVLPNRGLCRGRRRRQRRRTDCRSFPISHWHNGSLAMDRRRCIEASDGCRAAHSFEIDGSRRPASWPPLLLWNAVQ